MKTWLTIIVLLTALGALAQKQSAPAAAPNPTTLQAAAASTPQLQARDPHYLLHINDVFDVHFPFSPEFDQSLRVGPDGYVSLRGTNPVHVAGENTTQISEAIKKAYVGILRDPQVNITLKEFEKPYFVASGQVTKPGKYDLLGDTTVTQAVAMAGGFSKDAKHSQVLLFRRVNDNWVEVKKVDVKRLLKGEDLAEDIHLRPGDMLFVPKSAYSRIDRFIPNLSTGVNMSPRP